MKSDGLVLFFPISWSPDGKQLLLSRIQAGKFKLVSASGPSLQEMEARPVFTGSASDGDGEFSPDGHLIAYMSDESGKFEVYLSAWERGGPVGPPAAVSRGGASSVLRWSPDGKRVYFRQQDQILVSTSLLPRDSAWPLQPSSGI